MDEIDPLLLSTLLLLSVTVTTDAKWNRPMVRGSERACRCDTQNSIIILMELFHWPRTIAQSSWHRIAHRIKRPSAAQPLGRELESLYPRS